VYSASATLVIPTPRAAMLAIVHDCVHFGIATGAVYQ
jgi:hypothetical protein